MKYIIMAVRLIGILLIYGATMVEKYSANADIWEKRLPTLVKQRYSYDDSKSTIPSPYDDYYYTGQGANLKDLPLDLQNFWSAQVSPDSPYICDVKFDPHPGKN